MKRKPNPYLVCIDPNKKLTPKKVPSIVYMVQELKAIKLRNESVEKENRDNLETISILKEKLKKRNQCRMSNWWFWYFVLCRIWIPRQNSFWVRRTQRRISHRSEDPLWFLWWHIPYKGRIETSCKWSTYFPNTKRW